MDTWHRQGSNTYIRAQRSTYSSGQGHDLTQTGHVWYRSIRLDEKNTMNLFWSLYLVPMNNYCSKTVFDLWWRHVTSEAQTHVIWTIGVKIHIGRQHLPTTERFRVYWLKVTAIGGFWIFPHWLIMGFSGMEDPAIFIRAPLTTDQSIRRWLSDEDNTVGKLWRKKEEKNCGSIFHKLAFSKTPY